MRKITTIAAMVGLSCLGAFEMPKIDVNTSVGFDSEYVYRGIKRGQQVFLPKAEISLAVFEHSRFYVSANAAIPLSDLSDAAYALETATEGIGAGGKNLKLSDNGKSNEPVKILESVGGISFSRVDCSAGIIYSVTDKIAFDVGYTHYCYTNVGKSVSVFGEDLVCNQNETAIAAAPDAENVLTQNESATGADSELEQLARNQNEIYIGVSADAITCQSLYVFYNFECREVAIEGKVSYTLDLGQFGLNKFLADFSCKAGFDRASRLMGANCVGANSHYDNNVWKNSKDYIYYSAVADLVYSLNEKANMRVGVEYVGNSAKNGSSVKRIAISCSGDGHKNMLFFRSSVDCAF